MGDRLARDLELERGERNACTEIAAKVDELARRWPKVDELALAVERLSREANEFHRLCDVRLDTATRAAEQLRVTEGAQRNELWRELRQLRSQFSEIHGRRGAGTIGSVSGTLR